MEHDKHTAYLSKQNSQLNNKDYESYKKNIYQFVVRQYVVHQ